MGEPGGHFGRWITDEWGLPAYQYECDHRTDPNAVYQAMGLGHRRHWHQLGNDRIIAIGDNDGCVQVYQNEGGAKWLNHLDPDQKQYAGGLGYLTDGKQVIGSYFTTDHFAFIRQFGISYFRKVVSTRELTLDHIIFAPFGDHPLLLSVARIANRGPRPVSLDYFEYWGSYQYQLTFDAFITSYGAKDHRVRDANRADLARQYSEEITFDEKQRALLSTRKHPDHERRPEGPHFHDLQPPATFLACLGAARPVAFETDAEKFFGDASALAPAMLKSPKASSREYAAKPGAPRRGCMVFQHRIELEPGYRSPLVHAFGYLGEDARLDSVLAGFVQAPEASLPRSMEEWRRTLPAFHCPEAPWAQRETVWNGYNLRAGSSYDSYFESHILSQGCTYQYQTGFNAAARDPLQHALPVVLYAPQIARDTLRYTMREASPRGHIPYAICGHGQVAPVHWRPSDFDLWLLWLTSEYVLATRDTAFLEEELPFYPKEDNQRATVIDHLRLALTHLLGKVGRGRHGLLKIINGDWNDGIMEEIPTEAWDATMKEGETVLNSAMAAYVLPYAAELFDLAKDPEHAERARVAGQEIAEAVRKCWTGEWYLRAFACEHEGEELWVGRERLFLEPQPWSLIAGIPDEDETEILIENLNTHLRSDSPIGAVIAHPPREENMEAKLDLDPDGGNLFWGGVWYALNGTLIWALGKHVPELAWDELYKNSLEAHASAYPHVWFGIWSGPDSYNGHHSARPGYTWGQGTYVDMNEFPVMCLHAHAWPLYALLKLCGIKFSSKGISIDPRLPYPDFKLTTRLLGISYQPDTISGHYAPLGQVEAEITLRLPASWQETPRVEVDGQEVSASRSGDRLTFILSAPGGTSVGFSVSQV